MEIPDKQLPFSIGSEIELQIVNSNGKILRGEELINVWDKLLAEMEINFRNGLNLLPDGIRTKVKNLKRISKSRHGKKLPYLEITYFTMNKNFKINIAGPDPNISQITWILELVIPPSTTMHEFAIWNAFLNKIARESLPDGYWIIPLGLNPMDSEYRSGVTYGEHYHVGIHDPALKIAAYNMIRNYIPHLIALTVNSPFLNKKPTGIVKIDSANGKLRILGKGCIKSQRLFYNKGQLGPVDKETYIPCLKNPDHDTYCNVIRRMPPDDRYTDLYPFTSYETIELRFFDTQFSLYRRLAIVSIIEALCLKAYHVNQQNVEIPCVKSSVIMANREKSIEFGLHGKFTPDTSVLKSFRAIYNEDVMTGKTNGKMFQAVKGLLYFLRREISELDLTDCLLPFYVSWAGTKCLNAPITPADYLLYLYERNNHDFNKILEVIKQFQVKYCSNIDLKLGDPVIDEWGAPDSPLFTQPEKPIRDTAPRGDEREKTELPGSLDLVFKNVELNLNGNKFPELGIFPYKLTFCIGSGKVQTEIEILIIQHLMESKKKHDFILASAIKKFKIQLNKPVTITHDDFSLDLPRDLFIGNKLCFVQFKIKIPRHDRELSINSRAFWLELIPKIHITSDFKKKSLEADRKIKIKFVAHTQRHKIMKPTPMTAIFEVLSARDGEIIYSESIPVKIQDGTIIPMKLDLKQIKHEHGIILRLTLRYGEKLIYKYETREIKIIPPKKKIPGEDYADQTPNLWIRNTLGATTKTPEPQAKLEFSPAILKYKLEENGAPVTKTKTRLDSGSLSPTINTSQFKSPDSLDTGQPATTIPKSKKKNEKIKIKKEKINKIPQVKLYETIKDKQKPAANNLESTRKGSDLARTFEKEQIKSLEAGKVIETPFTMILKYDKKDMKLAIEPVLRSTPIIAPGNKIRIHFTIRQKKHVNSEDPIDLIAFFINQDKEILKIFQKQLRLKYNSIVENFSEDISPLFVHWKPTDLFYLVVQAYQYGTLIGETALQGFEIARFTTRDQLTIKSTALLSERIYPSINTALVIKLEVKRLIEPITLSMRIAGYTLDINKEFKVFYLGNQTVFVPFEVPFKRMPVLRYGQLKVSINDISNTIHKSNLPVSILEKGPLFIIKETRIYATNKLENSTLTFRLYNDGKYDVNCQVRVAAKIPFKEGMIEIGATRQKIQIKKDVEVEMQNVNIPYLAMLDGFLELHFFIRDDIFKLSENLITVKIPNEEILGARSNFLMSAVIKNLSYAREISKDVDKINLEIHLKKHHLLPKIQLRLIQVIDGVKASKIKDFKIPKNKDQVIENIYWKPPAIKNYPQLCKLQVIYMHDGEILKGKAIDLQPHYFVVKPR
ncbi:MAG: glutamate-cysteine ligase family protein [Promethearchaeota archaeon]